MNLNLLWGISQLPKRSKDDRSSGGGRVDEQYSD
jgi:hypothetical protein